MTEIYLVGHISVKETDKWQAYRSQVPATLAPWQAELVFRGEKMTMLTGEHPFDDIVVIRFPTDEALHGWHASPAYQALIPLRQEAAEVVLIAYRSV